MARSLLAQRVPCPLYHPPALKSSRRKASEPKTRRPISRMDGQILEEGYSQVQPHLITLNPL